MSGPSEWSSEDTSAPFMAPTATILGALVDEIRCTALAVYEDQGLPVRAGHYTRGPRASRWKFVAETLTPEERWRLVLNKPSGARWRYSVLEDLGLEMPSTPAFTAAQVLSRCRRLSDGVATRSAPSAIEDMIFLGADWEILRQHLAWRNKGRLKLRPPQTVPVEAISAVGE